MLFLPSSIEQFYSLLNVKRDYTLNIAVKAKQHFCTFGLLPPEFGPANKQVARLSFQLPSSHFSNRMR